MEREYEMIVKRTLESICVLTINPNTTTSTIVQVIGLLHVHNFSVMIFDIVFALAIPPLAMLLNDCSFE